MSCLNFVRNGSERGNQAVRICEGSNQAGNTSSYSELLSETA